MTEDNDGFSCLLCGGPRVLVEPPIAREGGEKRFLERAKQLRTRRATWGVAAGVATAFGAVALAVSAAMALVMHLGANGGEVAATAVLGPLLVGAFGFSRVRRTSSAVRSALDEAELVVVGEILKALGRSAVDPGELAKMLHVSPARAEELAAQAQVEGFLTSADALLPPGERLRVDADLGSDQSVEALEAERRDRVR